MGVCVCGRKATTRSAAVMLLTVRMLLVMQIQLRAMTINSSSHSMVMSVLVS